MERNQQSFKGVTGKREAKKKAEELRNELNETAELSPTFDKDKTIASVVGDYLIHQLETGEIEQSTYQNRKYYYNTLIVPYIGDYLFITLDRVVINHWLSQLNARGLAQGTIGIAFYTVRKVYDYYYELGDITRNPFTGIKPPKKGDVRVTHLTKEQRKYFLDCLENEEPKFKLACMLAYYAGLRRGEICGLRWRDINFETGYIEIHTAIGIGVKKYAKQPKNSSSERRFIAVPQLLEELKNNIENDNYFVVGKGTDFISPSTLDLKFKQFVRKNHIVDAYGAPVTLHALRHNLAAIGITSGMDIASLSKIMGHSSMKMTLDTYGDATKDAMIVASNKLFEEFNKE